MKKLTVLLTFLAVLVAGCGTAGSDGPTYQGAALCTTTVADPFGNYVRTDPSFCPIGDGDVPGYPYRWVYASYPHHWYGGYGDLDYPYLGAPISTTVYHVGVPTGWRSLDVERDLPGNCGCAVRKGQTPPTHARVDRSGYSDLDKADVKKIDTSVPVAGSKKARQASSTVTRGGLGVKDRTPTAGTRASRSVRPPASRPLGSKTFGKTSSTTKGPSR